jgi:hypothetical protein
MISEGSRGCERKKVCLGKCTWKIKKEIKCFKTGKRERDGEW